MDLIKEPDVGWFEAQAFEDKARGVFGVWSGGKLDGWVGREGPMVQDALGGEDGGRVRVLEDVPHAFCLSKSRLLSVISRNQKDS
jgi:hypothetical protein